ncbi:hypothetical protein ACFVQ9_32185 [Streptomyces goshikiensis]|uniref:hypothetical protein n=1 Tax=Streptomyces goshikiensis TaxID=1942 RepID=UPI00367F1B6C
MSGTAAGGSQVTITGRDLTGATSIAFGPKATGEKAGTSTARAKGRGERNLTESAFSASRWRRHFRVSGVVYPMSRTISRETTRKTRREIPGRPGH